MDQGSALKLDSRPQDMEELVELDRCFFKVFCDLVQLSQEGAARCTESIFLLTSTYMKRETFDTLQKFYDLYFANTEEQANTKENINAAVDDIFDAASEALKQGKDLETMNASVQDTKLSHERLAAAGFQKQLEGLIVLDQGIRNEILPALSSMQFEDATRQRLTHLIAGWEKLMQFVQSLADKSTFSSWPSGELAVQLRQKLEETLLAIAKTTTSIKETEEYYRIVLRMPVPEGVAKGQDAGDILLF